MAPFFDNLEGSSPCPKIEESKIRALLPGDFWKIRVVEETGSTNDDLKGDPSARHGAVLLTRRQTQGRGRLGRSFASPEGGLYLSLLLEPDASPENLLHLTPMIAVALRRGIRDVCGLSVQIKWANDLVMGAKKLGGILTELTVQRGTPRVIVGIGINCNALPGQVEDMAVCLQMLTGKPVDLNALAAALLLRLEEMMGVLFTDKALWLREYEDACVTIGKPVQLLQGGERQTAFALGIDENGGLRVCLENGKEAVITTGEVSVRGMYGYV